MRYTVTVYKLRKLLGIGEEDVEEAGSSQCLPSHALFFTRLLSAIAYTVCILLIIITRKSTDFRTLWKLSTPWYLSVELLAHSHGLFSFILLAIVSAQHARATARSDLLARIAGPIHYVSATLSIFSLSVAGWTDTPAFWTPIRAIIYSVPLASVLIDISLGSRLFFRFRAAGIPLFVIQMQNFGAIMYMRFQTPHVLDAHSTITLVGLGVAWQAVGALCAVVMSLLSRVSVLFSKGPGHAIGLIRRDSSV